MAFNFNLPKNTQSYDNLSAFPITGRADVLYKAIDTTNLYTWNNSSYVLVDKRFASSWGQVSANQSSNSITKNEVGLGNVDNTSDLDKPISTATQNALNTKQNTLVSGNTIKTINSSTILGAGNLVVQSTLVSGTNIKTINGSSVLGSGNIVISGGSSNPSVIAVSVSDGTQITGSVLTISKSILVPANTIATNAILEIVWGINRVSGIAGNVGNQLYVNTSNTLTGATLIAVGGNLGTGQAYVNQSRDIQKVGTSAKTAAIGVLINDGTISTSINSFTLNNASALYFMFACFGGVGDVSVIKQARIIQYI